MNDTEKLIFTDDEGEEITLFVQAQTELGGTTYLLVTETEELEGDAYIFEQIEETDDELTFEAVDDDDKLAALGAVFEELLADQDEE